MPKSIVLFISLLTQSIFASSFDINNLSIFFKNNLNNIIYIIAFLLLIFIIFYLYKRKNRVMYHQDTKADYLYLNTLNKEVVDSYSNFLEARDDNKLAKNILNRLKEMNVFLSVKSDDIHVHRENFNLEEFINKISEEFTLKDKELNIITNSDISYSIITDKYILEDIFTLLALLQFREHNLKHAHIGVDLQINDKKLILKIDEGLSFNKHMQKVLEDATLTPFYNPKENFYYGLYLWLMNKLINELNGVLTINILEKVYTLKIELPVSIDQQEGKINLLIPKKVQKDIKALIICDDENLAQSTAHFLALYDIEVDVITNNKVVQIPSFVEYDLLITNSKFLHTIFSDYLISIKKYHFIKIVAIESQDENPTYKEGLVDNRLKKPIVQSKIYSIVLELFKTLENSEISLFQQKIARNKREKKKKKVLIADDNMINRNLLKAMIENYGVEVIDVSNGEEVLDVLENSSDIDLVILDSIMPKLDAYETIKKIRSKEEFNTIPVIIHSSFSFNGKTSSIEDIFKLGFDSYLPKPFNIEKLESILLRYLHVKPIVTATNPRKTQEYEEFIAIYSNSDKMIEKYVKEESIEQLDSLLKDLKNIAKKIDKERLYNEIVSLQEHIKNKEKITLDVVEPLLKEITITKYEIIKKLEY